MYEIRKFTQPFMLLLSVFMLCINFISTTCFIEETLALAPAVKAGAEKIAGITRDRFIKRLIWLKEMSRFLTIFTFDERKKTSFARITHTLESLFLDNADGRIRKQPYCIVLTGPPGSGKTGLAISIAAKFMRAKNGHFSYTDMITLNETDDFQSEFRNNHKVVIFDDIGAEKATVASINPWRKVLDFVNNTKKTSLNPNVELKGNVYIEPELVILTTNIAPSSMGEPWMVCPAALRRRFNHVFLIKKYRRVKEIIYKTTSMYLRHNAYVESGNYEDNASSTEYQIPDNEFTNWDDLEENFVREFIKHHRDQDGFVDYINSSFDKEDVRIGPFQSFYDDVISPKYTYFIEKIIKPHWFSVPPVPIEIEKKLPFYIRFRRYFCFVDHNRLTCQMGLVVSDNSSDDTDDKPLLLDEIFDPKIFKFFEKMLLSGFDSEFIPCSFGFIGLNDQKEIRTFYIHPNRLSEASCFNSIVDPPRSLCIGPSYTFVQLKAYCCICHSETTGKVKDEEIVIPTYEGEIIDFHNHSYGKFDFDTCHLTGRCMKQVLGNCQRKLPEMGVSGNLKNEPSALLTYQILKKAWHYDPMYPMAVEFNLNGLTVDGYLVINEVPVLVEAKTKDSAAKQVKRYMRALASKTPCIGVAINYYGYHIFYTNGVQKKELEIMAQICNAVFMFLEKYGMHFISAHPWKEYKDHCKNYVPPSKVVG
jgi:ABC-type dipeptide/oligopeptide/nickel transport system ATPase subunit